MFLWQRKHVVNTCLSNKAHISQYIYLTLNLYFAYQTFSPIKKVAVLYISYAVWSSRPVEWKTGNAIQFKRRIKRKFKYFGIMYIQGSNSRWKTWSFSINQISVLSLLLSSQFSNSFIPSQLLFLPSSLPSPPFRSSLSLPDLLVAKIASCKLFHYRNNVQTMWQYIMLINFTTQYDKKKINWCTTTTYSAVEWKVSFHFLLWVGQFQEMENVSFALVHC